MKSSHCVPSQIFRVGYFVRHHVAMRLLGYTRVSTAGQDPALQLDALLVAGVQKRDVFSDVTSGAKSAAERPGMKKLLAYAEPEDTVVVWRIDDWAGR